MPGLAGPPSRLRRLERTVAASRDWHDSWVQWLMPLTCHAPETTPRRPRVWPFRTTLAWCWAFAAAPLLAAEPARAPVELVYPRPESASDTRYQDLIDLLRAALEHTRASDGPYLLRPSGAQMNEARQLLQLQQGKELNVVWSSTSIEKERVLLPLRIPLRKGLLGYRIALIHKDAQARIDQAQTLGDLRGLRIGLGVGWGENELYAANGLSVVPAQYDSLFRMAARQRFDLFPRGISEVFKEYELHRQDLPELVVEQHLLIQYTWPYYFFFNKKDAALQRRVETGLRAMMRDGSFDAIFEKYNRADIQRAHLAGRRIIRINNPLLPPQTPQDDRSLWFDPQR